MDNIKKEVSLQNIFIAGLPIIAGLIAAWITINNQVSTLQAELQTLKAQRNLDRAEMRDELKELKADIKEIKNLIIDEIKTSKPNKNKN
jgi:cell division protein FtsB